MLPLLLDLGFSALDLSIAATALALCATDAPFGERFGLKRRRRRPRAASSRETDR